MPFENTPTYGDFEQALLPHGLINSRLSKAAFQQLSGCMSGIMYVKVVFDKIEHKLHFINDKHYSFHADYIAEQCLKVSKDEVRGRIDDFNHSVYVALDRRFYLGIVSRHKNPNNGKTFFALETVDIDKMDDVMIPFFYGEVKKWIDSAFDLFFKPASCEQEKLIEKVAQNVLPHVSNHELYANTSFVALNYGEAKGRIRIFNSQEEFLAQKSTLEWYDILVMDRVPDEIPRISGIINSHQTTPLSHTNVLAHGWGIPNAIQKKACSNLGERGLNGQWVRYAVTSGASGIVVEPQEHTPADLAKPAWRTSAIVIDPPEPDYSKIVSLCDLRASDHKRYGTKAANLGELFHLMGKGSSKLLGYYLCPRPPRDNLLPYLCNYLETKAETASKDALKFLCDHIKVPRGIALPFAIQQRFLESSPQIQQCIGKLKMALELDVKEIDAICVRLQQFIRNTPIANELRDMIEDAVGTHLCGVSTFVVRSSSNAEDLANFSAAGIYDSINHVSTIETLHKSIKHVWASLVSPRSVRLRQQVGISLDDVYMGVIIQEQMASDMGGVMVTTNPLNAGRDIRSVYINVNASSGSVSSVVGGLSNPYQYLCNTVEGGVRTISFGDQKEDILPEGHKLLERLSFAGRLLQAHFSPDYTFETPIDVEWIAKDKQIFILQLRPYVG